MLYCLLTLLLVFFYHHFFFVIEKVIFVFDNTILLFKRLQWLLTAYRIRLKLQSKAVPNVALQFSFQFDAAFITNMSHIWAAIPPRCLCLCSAFDLSLPGLEQFPSTSDFFFGELCTLFSVIPHYIIEITSILQSILVLKKFVTVSTTSL